jgi:hypothetical protein
MDARQIENLEKVAAATWYEDGEPWRAPIPKNFNKEYVYCKGEVVLYVYDAWCIVEYAPTNVSRRFWDRDRAFSFAKARAEHVRAINALMY